MSIAAARSITSALCCCLPGGSHGPANGPLDLRQAARKGQPQRGAAPTNKAATTMRLSGVTRRVRSVREAPDIARRDVADSGAGTVATAFATAAQSVAVRSCAARGRISFSSAARWCR